MSISNTSMNMKSIVNKNKEKLQKSLLQHHSTVDSNSISPTGFWITKKISCPSGVTNTSCFRDRTRKNVISSVGSTIEIILRALSISWPNNPTYCIVRSSDIVLRTGIPWRSTTTQCWTPSCREIRPMHSSTYRSWRLVIYKSQSL